ncbi:DUF4326 domain-containing protein [Streptomyces umbrinus]|uniref:DUF4326 domain-containing protein n=1 Tax=Streptomyces umbrinus TaxID=67370 RepID=UPI003C2E6C70
MTTDQTALDTQPRRIQRRRTKGWRAPADATYVGRGSKWGNPFAVVRTDHPDRPWRLVDVNDRSRSLREDPQYFTEADKVYGLGMAKRLFELHTGVLGIYEYDADALADLRRALAGRDLMCWCLLPVPGQPDHCHGAVLLELANPQPAVS